MKKLSVRVGEYQDQSGQTKGRYVNIGVLMQKDGKEFVLLDPSVSIAGLYGLQQADAMKKNEPLRDRVLVGIFEEDNQQQGQQQNQQQGYQPQQRSGQQQNQNQQQQNSPPAYGARR